MQRFTMRVQLDQEARDALVELCDRSGMTQIAVMSRVLTWFSRQNEVIQARVLGGLSDETVAELARQMLERMATGELDEAGHRRKPGAARGVTSDLGVIPPPPRSDEDAGGLAGKPEGGLEGEMPGEMLGNGPVASVGGAAGYRSGSSVVGVRNAMSSTAASSGGRAVEISPAVSGGVAGIRSTGPVATWSNR